MDFLFFLFSVRADGYSLDPADGHVAFTAVVPIEGLPERRFMRKYWAMKKHESQGDLLIDLGASDRGWDLYSAKIYVPRPEDSAVSTFYSELESDSSGELSAMIPTGDKSLTPDPRQKSPPGITPSQREYLGRPLQAQSSATAWMDGDTLPVPVLELHLQDRDLGDDLIHQTHL